MSSHIEVVTIRRPLSVLIVLLMLASVLLPMVPAGVMADDDKDDGNEPQGPTVKKSGQKITIKNEVKTDNGADDFKLEVLTAYGLRLTMESSHEAERVQTHMKVRVVFKCMVGTAKGVPEPSEACDDDHGTMVSFRDMDMKELRYYEKDVGGMKVHKVEAYTKDYSFKASFETKGGFSEGEDGSMVPDPIFVSMTMNEFEFGEGEERLALVMEVEADHAVKVRGGNEEGTTSGDDDEVGTTVLRFDDKASVDGVQQDVKVRTEEDADGGTMLTLSYPAGDIINHDASFGVLPNLIVLKGDILLYGGTIAAVVVVVALTDKRFAKRLGRK